MAKILDTNRYLDTVCSLLQEGHVHVPVTVSGASMTPFLDPGDTVFLDRPDRPVETGDVILFLRPGQQYVLHRVVKVFPNGALSLLGDAQVRAELVRPEDVCAIVTGIRRGEKLLDHNSLRWRFFRDVWIHTRRVRPFANRIRNKLKK